GARQHGSHAGGDPRPDRRDAHHRPHRRGWVLQDADLRPAPVPADPRRRRVVRGCDVDRVEPAGPHGRAARRRPRLLTRGYSPATPPPRKPRPPQPPNPPPPRPPTPPPAPAPPPPTPRGEGGAS